MTTQALQLVDLSDTQATPAVDYNRNNRVLEAKAIRIISRTTTAEPAVVDGAAYLVPTGATGSTWPANVGKIAVGYSGVWNFFTPIESWRVWINDEDIQIVHTGTAWIEMPGILDMPTKVVNTTPYTVTAADRGYLLLVDPTGGNITLNLTAAATLRNGFTFGVKKTVATNQITLDPNGSENIDGALTLVLSAINDSRIVTCSGTAFWSAGGGGSGGGGGGGAFTDLTDVPSSYATHGEKMVRVATGETALEFFDYRSDANHHFHKSADTTARARLLGTLLPTATTILLTIPGADGTLARLEDISGGGNGSDSLAYDSGSSSGLDYAYFAGGINSSGALIPIAADSITLADNDVNYVEVNDAGVVSSNVVSFTVGAYALAEVTTVAGAITVVTDRRYWIVIGGAGGSGNNTYLNAFFWR